MFEVDDFPADTRVDGPALDDFVVRHPETGEWVALEPADFVDDAMDAAIRALLMTDPPGTPPAGFERLEPGPESAAALAGFDPSTADAYDVVEAAAAWMRLASWVAAGEAAALADLAGRAELRPADVGYRSVNPVTSTAVEVAGRCQVTARQAENLVGHSLQLVQDFSDTWAALSAGLIDLRRARVITDELGGQEPVVRQRVEAAVLPVAPELDSVALRKLIKRLLHELAPVEAAERHQIARDGRYVAVTPASDGMAFLEALLPAEDATALNTALNTAAADAKRADAAAGGPVRTKDQRRADALAELAWAALAACADGATAHDVQEHAAAAAPMSTGAGPATWADRAAGAALGRQDTDADGGSSGSVGAVGGAAFDSSRGMPGSLRDTVNDGAGHRVSSSAGGVDSGRAGGAGDVEAEGSVAQGSVSGGAGEIGVTGVTGRIGGGRAANPAGSARRRPVSVHVTIPFGALAGLSDEPGELEGYGPIPAQVARELAAAGVWTWLRTDPGTGRLLDLGARKYRPTRALADFVAARDRTCRMPGCHRPAATCDIDHVVPFAAGGPTSAANCQGLCETHHLLKHHGGWRARRERDGTTRWRSPTGHGYVRPPERIGPVASPAVQARPRA